MNTGFLGPAVATVLTVYGIETYRFCSLGTLIFGELQQYLPFTVLKHRFKVRMTWYIFKTVATVLTVYGIETIKHKNEVCQQTHVATVLTVYGIETSHIDHIIDKVFELQQYLPFTVLKLQLQYRHDGWNHRNVATVLTVYGIETMAYDMITKFKNRVATVLTVYGIETNYCSNRPSLGLLLQQYLPFTVLKHIRS